MAVNGTSKPFNPLIKAVVSLFYRPLTPTLAGDANPQHSPSSGPTPCRWPPSQFSPASSHILLRRFSLPVRAVGHPPEVSPSLPECPAAWDEDVSLLSYHGPGPGALRGSGNCEQETRLSFSPNSSALTCSLAACGSILSPEYTACAPPNSLLTSGTSTAPRRCRLFKTKRTSICQNNLFPDQISSCSVRLLHMQKLKHRTQDQWDLR